jgi:DNA-binding MarR family transcriptional regulator
MVAFTVGRESAMTAESPRRTITDVGALRVLADPVRYRLLRHLMTVGPQTATQCAGVVDATPSNCSYHLRELAKHDLIERVQGPGRGGGDGRERRWRATATGLGFDPYDRPEDRSDGVETDRVAELVGRELAHVRIDDDAAFAHAAIDGCDALPVEWRRAVEMAGYGLRITAAELTGLTAAIDALLRPYIAPSRPDAPEDARVVHVAFTALVPPS